MFALDKRKIGTGSPGTHIVFRTSQPVSNIEMNWKVNMYNKHLYLGFPSWCYFSLKCVNQDRTVIYSVATCNKSKSQNKFILFIEEFDLTDTLVSRFSGIVPEITGILFWLPAYMHWWQYQRDVGPSFKWPFRPVAAEWIVNWDTRAASNLPF